MFTSFPADTATTPYRTSKNQNIPFPALDALSTPLSADHAARASKVSGTAMGLSFLGHTNIGYRHSWLRTTAIQHKCKMLRHFPRLIFRPPIRCKTQHAIEHRLPVNKTMFHEHPAAICARGADNAAKIHRLYCFPDIPLLDKS